MSKHTPGPWRSISTDNDLDMAFEIPGVAAVYRGPHEKANAALIKDAPAMLEALRDALPTVEDAAGIYDEAGREAVRATVVRIRAILERHQ